MSKQQEGCAVTGSHCILHHNRQRQAGESYKSFHKKQGQRTKHLAYKVRPGLSQQVTTKSGLQYIMKGKACACCYYVRGKPSQSGNVVLTESLKCRDVHRKSEEVFHGKATFILLRTCSFPCWPLTQVKQMMNPHHSASSFAHLYCFALFQWEKMHSQGARILTFILFVEPTRCHLTWRPHTLCTLRDSKQFILVTKSFIGESYHFIVSLLVPGTTPFIARGQQQNSWDHLFFLWFS